MAGGRAADGAFEKYRLPSSQPWAVLDLFVEVVRCIGHDRQTLASLREHLDLLLEKARCGKAL